MGPAPGGAIVRRAFAPAMPRWRHGSRAVGADVVGVDWRVPLDAARERVGHGTSLQGNLDPTVVFAGAEFACEAARDVLRLNDGHPGHVFNLGHGVMPAMDPDVLTEIVKVVHEEGTVRS